jgi:methionyl-tRNA formyltransferase
MTESLRIVSFNVFPAAYELVAVWAAAAGHRIVLVVTSPSPRGERYGAGHRELITMLPPEQDVLVTTRVRRTAAPVIAALAPDLIISASFPHRIPAEVTAIPRLGAVNLHPAPLPRGRGPNPIRLVYEGDMTVAGTLHRIAPEFDAGAILSSHQRRLPDDVTGDAILEAWQELLREALDEGVDRALRGEPGAPQDEAMASYAAPFTEEERWICWDEPAQTIQRKVAALSAMRPVARAHVGGEPMLIARAQAGPPGTPRTLPGTVLDRDGETFTIQTADGVVLVTAEPLAIPAAIGHESGVR